MEKTKQKEQTIYDLDLHETLCTKFGIVIMRVPSGWIYDCWNTETDNFKTGVFVPFDNRFQIAEPLEPKEEFETRCNQCGWSGYEKDLIIVDGFILCPKCNSIKLVDYYEKLK